MFLHISFGLPGPLWPAFELKTALPTAANQTDATALAENAIKLPKRPTNIEIFLRQIPQIPKMANLGG